MSDENVGPLNDYVYYLCRNKNSVLAARLLKEVHKKFPERVVAILNLADAYWDIGMKSDACPIYKEYIAKMTKNGKDGRIPQSAKSRENVVDTTHNRGGNRSRFSNSQKNVVCPVFFMNFGSPIHDVTKINKVNGIIARNQAYTNALVVLTEQMNFPDATGKISELPDPFKARRQ